MLPCRFDPWEMAKPGPKSKSSLANQASLSHRSPLATGEAHHEVERVDHSGTTNKLPSLYRATPGQRATAAGAVDPRLSRAQKRARLPFRLL